MVIQTPGMSLEEFDDFIARPENENRLFELINGEIIEKMPSNAFASKIAGLILYFIQHFIRENRLDGHVTEGQGGFIIAGQRIAPDVAYISAERQPQLADEGYNPNPPELAVEVEHPTSEKSERRLRRKLSAYMTAGTILWVVYPSTKEVEVYIPGQPVQVIGIDGKLNGADILPGFTLPLKDIFKD